MKIRFLFGLIVGVVVGMFLTNFLFIHYQVYEQPKESTVSVGDSREPLVVRNFAEVNDLLGEGPEPRRAFVFPTSDTAYSIVYLPSKGKEISEAERKQIDEMVREKLKEPQLP